MNTIENTKQDSYDNYRISFPGIASAISALLLCSCASYSEEHQTAGTDAVYNPLPYRPLSELWKDTPHSIDMEELKKWEQLRNFMTDSSLAPAEEEFVDDNGNIFTREQLESGNQ